MSETATEAKPNAIPSPAELGFDPAELRRKYAAEREKRVRADGNNQYREITGALEHYNSDPYVKPGFTRPAMHEQLDAVIVGGGFGGMLAAARLQQVGITNIRIIEKAGDFGGTWYWNRYPGAQCDIESYVYLPLLEETGYIPREKYSFAPEIFEHAKRIGRHFNLYDRACFQTQVREARWDNDDRRWTITTDRGDVFKARYVIMSSGPLNRPKLPAIPGIENFKGHTFHTSRWDYNYTGGDTTGGLHKLADKRVGIVGTGATAIQSVSHLGEHSKQLYVFQRTPSSVDERGNKPTDPEWVKTLTPGWQAYRNHNFCAILSGIPIEEDLVGDKWTSLFKNLSKLISGKDNSALSSEEMALMSEIADYQKMNEVRNRVSSIVKDPATAEALKAWYGQWCKRPTFNDEYLPTFNRPNVKLVDTKGKGVDRVTEKGVVVDGVEYEARLSHLRHRLRGRHRLHPALRVRGVRPQRTASLRLLVQRHEDSSWLPQPRLPQPLSHGSDADRPRPELHLHAGRSGQSHRPHRQRGEGPRGPHGRAHPRGRSRMGQDRHQSDLHD